MKLEHEKGWLDAVEEQIITELLLLLLTCE